MELASYCIIEGNELSYTCIDKKITMINYETSLTETNMILILDIDGKIEFNDFNN